MKIIINKIKESKKTLMPAFFFLLYDEELETHLFSISLNVQSGIFGTIAQK